MKVSREQRAEGRSNRETDNVKRVTMPAPARSNRPGEAKNLSRHNPAIAALCVAALLLSACSGSEETASSAGQCEISSELVDGMKPLASGELAAFVVLDRPEPIGELSFENARGEPTSISAFEGKTTLVNLWATWCVPCREEMPYLKQLHEEMAGDDFAVVPVSMDLGTADKPKTFYREMDLDPLPFYHDGKMAAFNTFKKRSLALGLPATILLGPDGCILGKLNGPAEWAGNEARALIEAAIPGPASN
jgi:thiol-disulfide isomerase/thioredoxin